LYEAEKKYYSLQLDLKTNSGKQIWHNLNSAVSMSKIKNKVNIPKLTVNDSEVINTKEICNVLNDYFVVLDLHLVKRSIVALLTTCSIVLLQLKIVCIVTQYKLKKLSRLSLNFRLINLQVLIILDLNY